MAGSGTDPATSCAPECPGGRRSNRPGTGLSLSKTATWHSAFIDPEADFSVFRRVSVLEPHVAFRSNWQRDQNRSRSRNVRASDVERIKEDVAGLLKDVFVERLEAAGYDVVNVADEDVLVVRPAIIDLDITAPDVRSTGRSRTYAASTGAATLFVELFDSLSSDLIGRAVDRRSAGRSGGFAMQNNRVTNRADARREFSGLGGQAYRVPRPALRKGRGGGVVSAASCSRSW